MIKVTCTDPKLGDVEYTIEPFIFTPENLNRFWLRSSRFATLFNKEIRNNFKQFLEVIMYRDLMSGSVQSRGLFWQISSPHDPFVGVLYLSNLILEHEADAHFTFLDGRLRGREPIVKEMLKYVFSLYNFKRLNVELPYYVAPGIFGFVRSLGFVQEGKKRKAAIRDGKLHDVGLFGILREDVLTDGS